MLGRITGIVCLMATFAPIGFAGSAQAQSMDMMSALMLSNRFVNPVNQHQPVSYTAEATAKATDNKAGTRAAQSDRAVQKASAKGRHAEASLQPLKVNNPR